MLLRGPVYVLLSLLAVVSVLSLSGRVDASNWLMLVWSQVNSGGCLEPSLPPSYPASVCVCACVPVATKKVCIRTIACTALFVAYVTSSECSSWVSSSPPIRHWEIKAGRQGVGFPFAAAAVLPPPWTFGVRLPHVLW